MAEKLKIKKFTKVFDVNGTFVGFVVGKWGTTFTRVLLLPAKNKEIELESILDLNALEKYVMTRTLFPVNATHEKLMKKFHKIYGTFKEKDYPKYLIKFALTHHVRFSQFYKTNVCYILLHDANINVQDTHITLLKSIDEYQETSLVSQIESVKVFGENLRGFIGQVTGPTKITFSVGPSGIIHEIFSTFTTGDATLTLHTKIYVELSYGDYLVVYGRRDPIEGYLNATSIYSLRKGILTKGISPVYY